MDKRPPNQVHNPPRENPAKRETLEQVRSIVAHENLSPADVRERATLIRAAGRKLSSPSMLRLASAWKQVAQEMERAA